MMSMMSMMATTAMETLETIAATVPYYPINDFGPVMKGMVIGLQWALRMHGFGGHLD